MDGHRVPKTRFRNGVDAAEAGPVTGLSWLGAFGSWLFVVTFLLDGWARPGYHPVRHAVSALALGRRGWIQTANFIVCGLAITAGAVALADAADSLLLALVIGAFGVSLIASGVFPMDAMRGYPPGTPEGTPTDTSTRHQWHDWAGAVVFGSLPIAAIIAAFVLPETVWKWYSALTAILMFAAAAAFGQAWENDHPRTGLLQRAAIIVGWLWLGLLFAHTTR
ncbi:DUF998 domain-containing protein [Streptomyces johnsoniae]|uniref:DUF998 domain-containing protein n=1 Tax=Streptomyces johnsoniae TaxID=3075532 RepID=A0ABU2S1C9_9ACTN|nr:DUF998 domain-containing protein [Streptomyces sp. DSM 41886]MDT0441390.1 DUF998 domain-containing protein [Streptomyces sp. DSM 41886]